MGLLREGRKRAGHRGWGRVTVRSLDVVKVDSDKNLMLVKGPVPGHNKAIGRVRPGARLYRGKGAIAAG